MKNFFSFLFISLFSVSVVLAQQKTTDIRSIDGVQFYVHEIKKQETLYGISRLYDVSSQQIIDNNLALRDKQLQVGQVIFIPVLKPQKSVSLSKPGFSSKREHIVVKKETLYSLSKKFQVQIGDILRLNPDVETQGLKEGDIIMLPEKALIQERTITPQEDEIANSSEESIDNDTQIELQKIWDKVEGDLSVTDTSSQLLTNDTLVPLVQKDVYQIALFLPFFTEVNKENMASGSPVYGKSAPALDIYCGVKMALDSLKNEGLSVNLKVYDTKNDSSNVKKLIKTPDFKNNDLIIGPLYSKQFKIVSDEANFYSIPIVCPVPISSKVLEESPYTYLTFPSSSIKLEKIGNWISENFSKEKLIIVDQDGKHKDIAKNIISKFNFLHSQDEAFVEDSAVYVNFFDLKISVVRKNMSASRKNIILLMSNDKAFVSDFITQLNLVAGNHEILLVGDEKWKDYTFIDPSYLQRLNLHLVCSYFTSENSLMLKPLQSKFYVQQGQFLSKYFLSGYNSAYYFGKQLLKAGARFSDCINNVNYTGLGMNFDFKKFNLRSGVQNTNIDFLQFKNFQFQLIDTN